MSANPVDDSAGRLFNFVQIDFFPVLCHFLLPPSFSIHYCPALPIDTQRIVFAGSMDLFALEISYQKYEHPVNKETAESGETVDHSFPGFPWPCRLHAQCIGEIVLLRSRFEKAGIFIAVTEEIVFAVRGYH